MANSHKVRFDLLPYRALAKRWRWPAFLLIPAGVGLYWILPHVAEASSDYRPLGFVISVVGAVIFAYTLLAARARITCHGNRFVVHTPLYPVAFSYQRVELVRPVQFSQLYSPTEVPAAKWRLYRDLWGRTVPTITLKGLPLPEWWLRLWFHPYLFHPKERGLVIPVKDWMGFIRQLESRRTEWRHARGMLQHNVLR